MNDRLIRAALLLDRSRFLEAEAELRAARADGDQSATLHSMLGICLLNSGLNDAASREIRTALQLDPDCSYAYLALSYVQQANLRFFDIPFVRRIPVDRGEGDCLKSILRAVELAPNDHRLFIRLAEVHQLFRNWKKSLSAAEQALALVPESVSAAVLRAEALTHFGRRTEALATLERALSVNPEAASAHAGFGWAMLRAGNRERAREFFDEALRLDASLSWAQSGALECAKNNCASYRWLYLFKEWFSTQHTAIRLILGVALIVSGLFAMVGFFNLLDPLIRPRIGNQATGLFFVTLSFLILVPAIFHEQLFLFLVRRNAAAQSSMGHEMRHNARQQTVILIFGVSSALVSIVLSMISLTLQAACLGLVPGTFCLWLTRKHFHGGIIQRWWTIYAVAILLVGPVVGIVFHSYIRAFEGPAKMIIFLLPVVPPAIAVEYWKKKELQRRHDSQLAALSKTTKA